VWGDRRTAKNLFSGGVQAGALLIRRTAASVMVLKLAVTAELAEIGFFQDRIGKPKSFYFNKLRGFA
jgi:hypothetical protein